MEHYTIATIAQKNPDFRRVLWTGKHTQLVIMTIPPGGEGYPPHCHAAEEELFVVLEGSGTVTLGDENAEIRRGSVVSRPPGTRVAHSFLAGDDGLVYLAYGTREPNDVVYYPRTDEIRFRGVGVTLPAGTH